METITLQVHLDGQWQDAMRVSFDTPEDGLRSRCSARYEADYLVAHLDELDTPKAPAVSAVFPLGWEDYRGIAPAFLHDIVPAGAARRHILARMAVPLGAPEEFFLLQRCTMAPIGNLRVKESVAASGELVGFPREEVIRRDIRFLDYAYEHGAAIGGATGAGGEAPKLLLAEDAVGNLHPDASLPDAEVFGHWFVKFPRNSGAETDRLILHSEYCYYRALNRLRIETISAEGLTYEEAEKPSLWMRRFDRRVGPNGVERIAVESAYSLCGVTRPGSRMEHVEVVARLAETWDAAGQSAEIPVMVAEYLRRDLLNQILGNTDNHGRNLSILRTRERIDLAPIYDFAPMAMDPEGVVRTTRWPEGIERFDGTDWRAACNALSRWGDPEELFEGLRADARQLLALPDLLSELGLPEQTWQAPTIPLARLEATLRRWGLL
ncbi:type II toxin-antitoxin system HipA family toxin [Azotobacter chroococcum]|uniref:HipA domain-containing protein n=1 Tax=Azotobacter chroococcum TaxID=353 RepID=A0AAP9Y9L2_9GAMM|nr:HipA domain-containing protein [Azotobacter chroococcum]QQE87245.1 HipA domain-containing protein [Azotobacter chroococcum]